MCLSKCSLDSAWPWILLVTSWQRDRRCMKLKSRERTPCGHQSQRFKINMHIFDPMNIISILNFFHPFETAGDNTVIDERAQFSCSHNLKKSRAAELMALLSLESRPFHCRAEEGVLTIYCEVVNYL